MQAVIAEEVEKADIMDCVRDMSWSEGLEEAIETVEIIDAGEGRGDSISSAAEGVPDSTRGMIQPKSMAVSSAEEVSTPVSDAALASASALGERR